MLKYQVVYASRTGNTQKIAAKIFETLPGTSKDIQKVEEAGKEADVYFASIHHFLQVRKEKYSIHVEIDVAFTVFNRLIENVICHLIK